VNAAGECERCSPPLLKLVRLAYQRRTQQTQFHLLTHAERGKPRRDDVQDVLPRRNTEADDVYGSAPLGISEPQHCGRQAHRVAKKRDGTHATTDVHLQLLSSHRHLLSSHRHALTSRREGPDVVSADAHTTVNTQRQVANDVERVDIHRGKAWHRSAAGIGAVTAHTTSREHLTRTTHDG
jgi:hypothetical protein